MKKALWLALLTVTLLISSSFVISFQSEELQLRLKRNFGYASGTGKVQGVFTLRASGPVNLARVVYFIDDREIGDVTEAPFNLRFNTDEYELGAHMLYAVGYTTDGRQLLSNRIQAEFVTAEQGLQAAVKAIGPLLVFVSGIMVFSFVVTMFSGRKVSSLPAGTPRDYGMAGGAICTRCERPFPRHVLSPNMLIGKLERCPFCGKWGIVRSWPLEDLRAAEAAELGAGVGTEVFPALSEEERLRRDLDATRFQDP